MKKAETYIGIIAALFFAAFGFARFILPDKAMSEKENRVLKQSPALTSETLFNGEWGKAFEVYLTDQFPLRDVFLGLRAATETFVLQKTELRGIYPVPGGRLLAKTETPDITRSISAFTRIQERFDIPITVMLPPTAASVLPELLPAYAPVGGEPAIIRAAAEAAPLIDLTGALRSVGGDAYFRTDHHWTMRGAYEAYAAYIAACGMNPLPLDAFEVITVTREFYGTSYAKACLWMIEPEPIQVLVPKDGGYTARLRANPPDPSGGTLPIFDESKLEVYDKYAYFLGGNQALHVIESNAKTERTLAVVKDSFAHILAPMLSLHFDTIVMLDPRYVNTDPYELLESFNPTDLLLLFNTGNMGEGNGLGLFLRY